MLQFINFDAHNRLRNYTFKFLQKRTASLCVPLSHILLQHIFAQVALKLTT